jgi:DNA-binding SARP family transcriptional activator
MDIRYRIRSFGRPAVEGPNGPLGGCAAQRQALALLTVVAAAGERGLSRDKIVALLWPETDTRRSSHRLSQLLHALRRTLGEDALLASAGEIRVNPDRMTSDVAEFHAARSRGALDIAAECYSGPFMDGFFLGDAPEFERWVESERAALTRAYGEALETLAIEAEAAGERASASRWWSLLAAHEPLSSRVIMRLMSALAAYGDRAGALHHAHRYEVGVERELEAAPNPAVLALADRLRRTAIAGVANSDDRPYSIAVSPILNLSSAASNDYLAEGLVEELTNSLSRLEGVRLVAVPSAESIARPHLDAILEGSIRQADGRIRVILRLVDPEDGSYVWSQRYERQLHNVFELQDELTGTILQDMKSVLHSE